MKKVLGIVLLVVVICAIVGGSKHSSTSSSQGSSQSSGASGGSSGASGGSSSNPRLGQPADDGTFRFVVNSVACGIPSVGDVANGLGATAQGQFCKVNMTVKNIGTSSGDFFSSNQYAYDASGNQYSDSSDAEIYANSTILSTINPGNSSTGNVYFDIPKGTSLAYFELHDSAFSGGVRVDNK